jgi:membrane associated rhomboid family serine protease
LSTGFGAAALQLLLYYYQIDYVNTALNELGLTNPDINNFYSTAELPTSAINEIGEGSLSSAFNAYRSVMVGASGALYGVLVGFAMLFPNAQLMLLFPPIPVKAKFLVPILIFADLFFGFSSYSIGPIAHFAHVGGAITGLAMMWYWKKNQFDNNRWDS